MSWDDEDFNALPVFHDIKDRSTAWRMIGRVGGAGGIRKDYQTNADSTVTRLSTRNGMPELITDVVINPTVCELGMDSGVVDLTSAGFFLDANSNDGGVLHHTTYIQEYIDAAAPGDKLIIDKIHPPELDGIATIDGSPALSYPFGNYTRKRASVQCPVSIFTGKTRLYVQALYGRHKATSNIEYVDSLGTPSLNIKARDSGSDIAIDTNCGIYLDPSTAEHWLISVGTSLAVIYKLSALACAEKLRPKLLDASISIQNKERIEAYILAHSAPLSSSAQALSIPSRNPISMGYGWHFNWSGTACDIVINTYVDRATGGYENESTHYRLNFTNSSGVWSVAPTTVEGPLRWGNPKHSHVILSPLWAGFVLEKLGVSAAGYGYGNAPFYAFYNKDALRVCRYSSVSTSVAKGATRTPSYYNPGTYQSLGSDAVDYRTFNSWTGTQTTLSCGGTNISYRNGSHTESSYTHTSPSPIGGFTTSSGWTYAPITAWEEDLNTGRPSAIGLQTVVDPWEGTISVFDGSASGYTTTHHVYTSPSPYQSAYQTQSYSATWSTESFNSYVVESTEFIGVIPFYDAEAFYFLGTHSTEKTEIGNRQNKSGGAFFGAFGAGDGYASLPYQFINYYERFCDDSTVTAALVPFTRNVPLTINTTSKLICNAGVFDGVSFPATGQCFDPASDIVDADYATYSSAHGTAVYAPDNGVGYGVSPASLAGIPFTFVGWA